MKTVKFTCNPSAAQMLIREHWGDPNGCTVKFTKKDGSERTMIVRLDPGALAAKYDEATCRTNGTAARRETNKMRGNMVVSEWLPIHQMYQVRTIPLDKVYEVSFEE